MSLYKLDEYLRFQQLTFFYKKGFLFLKTNIEPYFRPLVLSEYLSTSTQQQEQQTPTKVQNIFDQEQYTQQGAEPIAPPPPSYNSEDSPKDIINGGESAPPAGGGMAELEQKLLILHGQQVKYLQEDVNILKQDVALLVRAKETAAKEIKVYCYLFRDLKG